MFSCCDLSDDRDDDDLRSCGFSLLRNKPPAELSPLVATSELLLLAALFLRFKFCWATEEDERRIAEPADDDATEGVVDLVDGRFPPPVMPLTGVDEEVPPVVADGRRRAAEGCCCCPIIPTTGGVAAAVVTITSMSLILSSCSLASTTAVVSGC